MFDFRCIDLESRFGDRFCSVLYSSNAVGLFIFHIRKEPTAVLPRFYRNREFIRKRDFMATERLTQNLRDSPIIQITCRTTVNLKKEIPTRFKQLNDFALRVFRFTKRVSVCIPLLQDRRREFMRTIVHKNCTDQNDSHCDRDSDSGFTTRRIGAEQFLQFCFGR